MGGILKNALSPEEQLLKEKTVNESIGEFRQQVYENTKLNAKLTNSNTNSKNGNNVKNILTSKNNMTGNKFIPKDTLLMKREQMAKLSKANSSDNNEDADENEDEDERLQWNQENLEQNEITKKQFQDIHVDEPKTPYQGAMALNGEYYTIDDEDNLNDFSLGEPEVKIPETTSLNEKVTIKEEPEQEDQEEEEGTEEEESAGARHRRFEEMRKKHYNVKHLFKKK